MLVIYYWRCCGIQCDQISLPLSALHNKMKFSNKDYNYMGVNMTKSGSALGTTSCHQWFPFKSISSQCSHFIPPETSRKPTIFYGVFRGYKLRTLARNELTLSWRRLLSWRNQSSVMKGFRFHCNTALNSPLIWKGLIPLLWDKTIFFSTAESLRRRDCEIYYEHLQLTEAVV